MNMKEDVYGNAPIKEVEPGSLAELAGLGPGDEITRIDGQRLRDAIDAHVLLADDTIHELDVHRGSSTRSVRLETGGGPLGIEYEKPVFGRLMTCNNHCKFCFVDQLPNGLRKSFYVKDDDFRLSFLCGNFVTLTNLARADTKRIIDQRLSPLYVSLHSTDPETRKRIFRSSKANSALENIKRLQRNGIRFHVQIVMMRGVNDGSALEQTLRDLHQDYPGVLSVGVVPVGLTSRGKKAIPEIIGFDALSSAVVLEQIDKWRRVFGSAGPFAADEFFFLAGEDPPPESYYGEGFPQLENGIGLARMFLKSYDGRNHDLGGGLRRSALVTTGMGSWALQALGLESSGIKMIVCGNSLFGDTVNVCGLLPGRDIEEGLKNCTNISRALVPDVALSRDGLFVDDMAADELSMRCGVRIVPVKTEAAALLKEITKDLGDSI